MGTDWLNHRRRPRCLPWPTTALRLALAEWLALGYGSWNEYADAELKPAEGLAAEVRRRACPPGQSLRLWELRTQP